MSARKKRKKAPASRTFCNASHWNTQGRARMKSYSPSRTGSSGEGAGQTLTTGSSGADQREKNKAPWTGASGGQCTDALDWITRGGTSMRNRQALDWVILGQVAGRPGLDHLGLKISAHKSTTPTTGESGEMRKDFPAPS